ncbi:cation acetate symporter [Streptomyces europaeiscabiei]|uniref:solute symporter family protein n=1 Tax=Streptomyces europaeiscabiei TaxID=146819 RepID=UPI0029B525ED|nr:cation acetate symporter [Streptomyces europaeiscabiei]MDX3695484.1 cation acetate symporter [Streptomyces europaeiscabiei]
MTSILALSGSGGPFPLLAVFGLCVVCTLLLSIGSILPEKDELSGFYLGQRRLPSVVNGLAIFGSYMSAAGMLGNPGLIALTGYDGIAYVLAPMVAWSVLVLLVAEPYHSTSRFTIGDSLALRLHARPAHLAAGITSVVVCLLYLTAQLVGAGALAATLLGIDGDGAQRVVVASLGLLMVLYVVIGGMRAATLVQGIKAVVLLATGLFVVLAVLSEFGWSPARLLDAAVLQSGFGGSFLEPGIRFHDRTSKIDSVSLQLAFVLGAAALPHVLMRIGTVSSGRRARKSAGWAACLVIVFTVFEVVTGLGSAALIGSPTIRENAASGNTAVLLLAEHLGGSFLLTVVACVAFLTIVAVVAALTLTAAAALAHDVYGATIKQGRASEKSELFVARLGVGLIGVAAIALSMLAQHLNIAFLVSLAFAIAASAILPALLFNLWWKGFTTKGAVWSMYGGLLVALLLTTLSPAVSGNPTALLPGADFAVFPLRNPGLISIPVGFLLAWAGSLLDRRQRGGADYTETEIRVLTGVGTGPRDA